MNTARFAVIVAALLMVGAAPLAAQGTPEDAPPPDSAGGLHSAVETADLATDTTQVELSARERRSRRNMNVWLLESKLTSELRAYGRDQLNVNGDKVRALAAGGWIRFRSGRWRENFAFRASLFISMRLIGDTNNAPSQILAPDYGNLVTLGVLNADWYWKKNIVTVGRQDLNLPLVNKADSRMIPRTFLAAMGQGPLGSKWTWVGGYIARIKQRDADRFQPVSRIAGATGNRGMLAGGLTLTDGLGGHFSAGLYNYLVPDVHNLAYGEATWVRNRGPGKQFKIGVQGVDEHTVGNLLPGAPYSTQYFAGRMAGSIHGLVASFAVSKTTYGAELQSPYGLFPGYTSPMSTDFTRAGESAWHLGASYSLPRVADGLSAFVGYGRGSGGRDPTTSQVFSRDVLELTFDYRPGTGPMQGFWLRARFAKQWQAGAQPDAHDIRLIGYYTVPIPWPPPARR